MLLHPTSAKTQIINVREETDYQPNAVDVRVAKILQFTTQHAVLTESSKKYRETSELVLQSDGTWYLPPNQSFELVFESSVNIAEGEAGWLVPRSTLNRNGIKLTSGLYDSGYNGVIGATLHTGNASLTTAPGTRLAQFILVESHSKGLYNGSYGTGTEHDQKYHKE